MSGARCPRCHQYAHFGECGAPYRPVDPDDRETVEQEPGVISPGAVRSILEAAELPAGRSAEVAAAAVADAVAGKGYAAVKGIKAGPGRWVVQIPEGASPGDLIVFTVEGDW